MQYAVQRSRASASAYQGTALVTARLWRSWVTANALGELAGLGAGAVVLGAVAWGLDAADSPPAMLAGMIAVGLIEGFIVGTAQWLVLRQRFGGIRRQEWVGATVLGALVAWLLGAVPSIIASAESDATALAAQAEPGLLVQLLLSVPMGAILGLVLAAPQARVLRRSAEGALRWLPANAAAWAVGMPVVFLTVNFAYEQPLAASVVIVVAGLLACGAIVGAIHGIVLVRLQPLEQSRPPQKPATV